MSGHMHPGDTIEHSMTLEVPFAGHKVWIKVGGVVMVADGETGDEAWARLVSMVVDKLQDRMDAVGSTSVVSPPRKTRDKTRDRKKARR